MVRMVRRALVAGGGVVAAATLAFGAPALALTPIGSRALTVALSSTRAGVRPVQVTFRFSYMMQCGYPGAGPVTIALPSAERLPARLARGDVLVDGHAARSAALSGHTLTIALAPPPPIMCDVMGEGRLTVELTTAADIGNPLRAGSYTVTASTSSPPSGGFSASFTLRPN
jgi:hypothetical protein